MYEVILMEKIILILLIILIIGLGIISIMFYKQNKKIKLMQQSLGSVTETLEIRDIGIGEVEEFDIELIKKKIYSKNRDLVEFLKSLYESSIAGKIDNCYKKLKNLDNEVLEYGLIRMNVLENNFDISKIAVPTLTSLIFFVTGYETFFKEVVFAEYKFLQNIFPFLVTAFVYFWVNKIFQDSQKHHRSVIYFKGLIEYTLKTKNYKKND
jgi:hypothetical protein